MYTNMYRNLQIKPINMTKLNLFWNRRQSFITLRISISYQNTDRQRMILWRSVSPFSAEQVVICKMAVLYVPVQ